MRRSLALAISLLALLLLGTGPAWAAPDGRIQQVESQSGTVTFLLSAEGLAEGQSIDPSSVRTTIAGVEAQSTAVLASDTTAEAPSRTVMLVLDTSGSMKDFAKLSTAQSAANLYLDSLPPDVLAGLISFSDTAEVRVAPTRDRAAVSAAVNALEAGGGTALNDAVVVAVEQLGVEGSRNAVLLSDGNDADSTTSAKDARQALSDSGVVLDAVSLGEGSQEKSLARFAEAGSGTLVTATDADALSAAFASAARTVNAQLAVTAQVPEGVEAGTVPLDVAALVGDQPITDSAVAIIEAAAISPDYGPMAVPATGSTLFDKQWFLITVVAAVFIALGTIAVLAVGVIDTRNRAEGRIRRRLKDVSILGQPKGSGAKKPETVLGDSAAVRKAVSFADRVAASRNTTALAKKLDEANVTLRPGEWAIVHLAIALLAGLAATLLSGFDIMWAIAALAAGMAVPWLYLGNRAAKRRTAFYAVLPDSLQMLAGSLAAGYSMPQALDNVAREVGGPMGQELNRALVESRLGLPLEEALEAAAQRMQSQDFHWVVMAIRINRHVGGNLAEVLTNVSKTLRERERLRRQVKTLSAEGVLSAWILSALPFAIGLFIVARNPRYLEPLYTTFMGWVLVAFGAVAYVVGVIWMRKLVTMEV